MINQLLREWPPGYGGVERVSHELAVACSGVVYSLDVQCNSSVDHDPLRVCYPRKRLPRIKIFGRLHLPVPSQVLLDLLLSRLPLHGHLPSPGVLLVLLLARLIRPWRPVTAHWHCFLSTDNGFSGCLISLYQWLALRILPLFTAVVTTSPRLAQELQRWGCSPNRIFVLPCCLNQYQELKALALPLPEIRRGEPLRLLFIGRLDSYKRLDWLIESVAKLKTPFQLLIVGDGPKRTHFEYLAQRLFSSPSPVRFLGRLSEAAKFEQIASSDLLVLPASSSNEAFGIVQLEAMSAARIALALDHPLSGMAWVSSLPGLTWSQSREGLTEVLQSLADHPALRRQLCEQARQRYCELFARRVWMQELQRFRDYLEGGMVDHSVQ